MQATKADPVTQRILVIALSAHAINEHKESALQSGCDDYNIKPVDLPRLIAIKNAELRW